MEKRYFKAMATVTDGSRKWDVTIYSRYETIDAASDGIRRFLERGYDVVKTWIE